MPVSNKVDAVPERGPYGYYITVAVPRAAVGPLFERLDAQRRDGGDLAGIRVQSVRCMEYYDEEEEEEEEEAEEAPSQRRRK